MMSGAFMDNAFSALENRRALLVAGIIILVALCLVALSRAHIRADIRAMLPGGESEGMASDFDLLSRSTLSNRIMITVRGDNGVTKDELAAEAETLTTELPEPLFRFQSALPPNPQTVLSFLLDNAPNLMDQGDLEALRPVLTSEGVGRELAADYKQLTSPHGLALKDMIRRDPLNIRSQLAKRLSMYRSFADVTLHRGHVFSRDGHALLLTAETPVSVTDSDGAAKLIAAFDKVTENLPAGISATMVSGHLHAEANASVIKRDLTVISVVSFIALGLLFVFCFRSLRALGVLAAPLVSLCAALGMTALAYETMSAMVIGFGAVLLGISIDFAMHAYYAVTSQPEQTGKAMATLAKPLLFGLATSCAAFGALFFSGIPGIRQLAFFSIAGLIMAVLYALFVLPQLCRNAPARPTHDDSKTVKPHPRTATIITVVLLGAGILLGLGTTLDTDLRSMGYRSKDILQAEQSFNDTWGDMRDKAVVFVDGPDSTTAMVRNQRLWEAVNQEFPQMNAASLAPILPGKETQAENRALWLEFWQQHGGTARTLLESQGVQYKFSASAFAPFTDSFEASPAPMTPDSLEQAGLGMLLQTMAPYHMKGHNQMLTFLPDTEAVRAFFTQQREQELSARLVSRHRFKENLEATMHRDIVRFIAASGASVILLAFILFRDVRCSVLSLLPSAFGVAAVFAVLAATGTPMNLFHIVALPLVIGLGADYGIFMVCRGRMTLPLATVPAIRLSGLTTLAAFGVLALAKHPSLHSLGTTVLLGVGAALMTALYLLPHLLEDSTRRSACA